MAPLAKRFAPLGEAAPARPCRFCGAPLSESFCDLGASPLANRYLRADQLSAMEPTYPLHAYVCGECFLVQLEAFETPEAIFSDYAYFSSYSESWLAHASRFAQAAAARLSLGAGSLVMEVASNDGYLLQYFRERGVPVLGIEPAANVAEHAVRKGVPTVVRFFGAGLARELAAEGRRADLLVANNVLAHVPDLNDFVAGLALALKPEGALSIEFPHLLNLIALSQFDTIYHEHFSYFSFAAAERVLAAHDLRAFDVETLPTHGGSLRLWACRRRAGRTQSAAVARLRAVEAAAGLGRLETYRGFEAQARAVKRRLLAFLVEAREAGKRVAGYGAAAKGNTLLNYCGVRGDLLDYVVDRSPHKQGHFLPGTRIPVLAPEHVSETRPDYLLILPWNLRDEIVAQMAHIRAWGGRFVVPVPRLEVLP
jgi:SAM-dependent methyltransferase